MKNKDNSSPRAINILIGVAISVIIFAIATLVLTLICYNTENPTGNLGIFALSALLVSGAAGGFFLSRNKSRFGFGNTVASSIITAMIIMVISMAANGGISTFQLMNSGCYIMTSVLFAILGKGGRRGRKKRRHA